MIEMQVEIEKKEKVSEANVGDLILVLNDIALVVEDINKHDRKAIVLLEGESEYICHDNSGGYMRAFLQGNYKILARKGTFKIVRA